jgi:cell division protein FtsB
MEDRFNEPGSFCDMRLKILSLEAENEMLKDRVAYLESENTRLSNIIHTKDSIESF